MTALADAFGGAESLYALAKEAAKAYAERYGMTWNQYKRNEGDLVQEGVVWLLERPHVVWVREHTGEPLTPHTQAVADVVEHLGRTHRPDLL